MKARNILLLVVLSLGLYSSTFAQKKAMPTKVLTGTIDLSKAGKEVAAPDSMKGAIVKGKNGVDIKIDDKHIISLKSKEDLRKVFQQNKYIVINVSAPWCGHCQEMKQPFAAATKKFTGQVVATKVSTEDKDLKEIAGCFDGVPGFFYIRKQVGAMGREDKDFEMIDKAMARLCGTKVAETPAEGKSEDVKNIKSLKEFFEELRKNTNIVVDISAAWCGACKKLKKPLEKAATKYKGKVTVCEINADNKEFKKLLQLLGVSGLPTIFYIKKEAGTCQQEYLESTIKAITGQMPKVVPTSPTPKTRPVLPMPKRKK